MQFNIEILQTEVKTVPKSNGGSYQQLEVAYKDLEQKKVSSKKVMSFANKSVFETLASATTGNIFCVTSEKNEKTGYWDWISVGQAATAQPSAIGNGTIQQTNKTPRSTYETPEERAKKQVYIVKQSSISNAISLLSVGAKSPPDRGQVLELAQVFADWVLDNTTAKNTAAKSITGWADLDDDIPF